MRRTLLLAAFLWLLSSTVFAAVAVDNASSVDDGGVDCDPCTLSHTISDSTNGLLVSCISVQHTTLPVVNSVTWNSQNLTQLNRIEDSADVMLECWYLKNPGTGTSNVSWDLDVARNVDIGAISFTGVDQTTSFGTVGTANCDDGTYTSSSVTVTDSASGDLTLDAIGVKNNPGTMVVGADQTQRWLLAATPVLAGSTEVSDGSDVMSWSWDNLQKVCHMAFAVKQASAATQKPVGRRFLTMNWWDSTLVEAASGGGGGGGGSFVTGGWGSNTAGGTGQTTCEVTNLNDSGAGSLRACVDGVANRDVTFSSSLSGDLTLATSIFVRSNVTIDGSAANVTIKGGGSGGTLRIHSGTGTISNVRLKGIRMRECFADCVSVGGGGGQSATNVHITQSSFSNCGDGNIDITDGSSDVTLDYNILAACTNNSLWKYDGITHIAAHHNAFLNSNARNPQVNHEPEIPDVTDSQTTAHLENNLIWGWGNSGYGVTVECGSRVNAIENMFKCNDAGNCSTTRKNFHLRMNSQNPSCTANILWTTGNDTADTGGGVTDPDTVGNAGAEQPRPTPDLSDVTETACTAAHNIKALAGKRPLDSVDQAAMNSVTLPTC